MKEQSKFLKPIDNIVLSDLDNTLVEGGIHFNPELVVPAVTKAKQNGFVVGLSSDTPYEALEVWRDRFSMNGPIIAEKGLVVGLESGLIYNKSDSEAFFKTRNLIAEQFKMLGFVVWEGNPVEALRSNLLIGEPNDRVLLVNSLRKCSLGLFFRKNDRSGRMTIDDPTTNFAVENSRQFYPDFDLDEDLNTKHGLVLVARKGTNKRSGTKILMDNLKLEEIGMVGDSDGDFLGKDIAKHYAVENASDSFKSKTVYVSDKPLASGVADILEKIIE